MGCFTVTCLRRFGRLSTINREIGIGREVFGLNVLLVSLEGPPYLVGGVGRHVDDLAHELEERGHRVDVLSACPGRGRASATHLTQRLTTWLGPVCPTPTTPDQWYLAGNFGMLSALNEMDPRWEVVHLHDRASWPTALAACRRSGAPLVFTAHSLAPEPLLDKRDREYYWHLERESLLSSEVGIAVSRWIATELSSRHARPDILVVPNGVRLSGFPFRPRIPNRGPKVLTYLGRLTWKKGLDHLLPALVGLDRLIGAWHMVVAGIGPEYDALLRLAGSLGLSSQMTFLGELAHSEVPALFSDTDLAVFPSVSEAFGLTVIEAMACGALTATSRGTGIGTIFTAGVEGYQFDVADEADIRRTLAEALTMSPEREQAMAHAARQLVEQQYAWTNIAPMIEGAYGRAIERGRTPHVPTARPVGEERAAWYQATHGLQWIPRKTHDRSQS